MIFTYIFHFGLIFEVMHFVFHFISFFKTKENFFLRPFVEYTFLVGKQNVGAGIYTLMSIFDGLDPSTCCGKMEKARPMREEMDGNVVNFPPETAFSTFMLYFVKYFSLFVP